MQQRIETRGQFHGAGSSVQTVRWCGHRNIQTRNCFVYAYYVVLSLARSNFVSGYQTNEFSLLHGRRATRLLASDKRAICRRTFEMYVVRETVIADQR